MKDAGGVSIILRNSAEYAAMLMMGTEKMLAHGPFSYVARMFLPQFNGAWAAIVTTAWKRMPEKKAAKLAADVTKYA